MRPVMGLISPTSGHFGNPKGRQLPALPEDLTDCCITAAVSQECSWMECNRSQSPIASRLGGVQVYTYYPWPFGLKCLSQRTQPRPCACCSRGTLEGDSLVASLSKRKEDIQRAAIQKVFRTESANILSSCLEH